ncbi:MAG: hypothetical protein H5U20_07685 [Rhodobacteraceae bacterium]|nr:hypothetical protein [Paracoccaceae bacterium]
MSGLTDGERLVLVHRMAILVREPGLTEWERSFAASIVAADRRGRFRPSEKQVGVMRRIVADHNARTLRPDADPDAGEVVE